MRILCLLLCFAISTQAHAGEILRFDARIQNEGLAEEAIALLHCLAERSGSGWEFSGNKGTHWLELSERSGAMTGTYHSEGKSREIALRAGEAEQACDSLIPAAKKETPTLPVEGVMDLEPDADTPETRPYLKWAAISAALLGGFLLWRASRGPDYRSLEMR